VLICSGYKAFFGSFPTTAVPFTTNEPQSYVLGGRNHPLHINSRSNILCQSAGFHKQENHDIDAMLELAQSATPKQLNMMVSMMRSAMDAR